jgi:hypothetical protein
MLLVFMMGGVGSPGSYEPERIDRSRVKFMVRDPNDIHVPGYAHVTYEELM